MDTIKELEKYLEDECYSFKNISIGKHYAYEGYIVEKTYEGYFFCYSERGNKNVIKKFQKEKELVHFAYEKFTSDKWLKAHLVVWVWTEEEVKEAENKLREMNISFKRNDIINYKENQNAYRIFVFGKDILLLSSFKEKYFK